MTTQSEDLPQIETECPTQTDIPLRIQLETKKENGTHVTSTKSWKAKKRRLFIKIKEKIPDETTTN